MLDRSQSHQYHYYQPGIGTYVTSKSLSSNGRIQRIKSWYQKAKDSAIGSSFAEHVMGGYKFLMRYYSPGDQIFFIGFSRGAYIARFLAEMLDYIGLLEAGNEELVRFAWKTFAKWQQRSGDSEDAEEKKRLFEYMKAFRETFSRPISRIQFMGLFDTVNSVPRFENAWMQRSKFPYTARSSARVIRHAVGIDERRAKFRQDLISGKRPHDKKHKRHRPHFAPHRLENRLARHVDAQHHLHLHHQEAQAAQATQNSAVPSIQVNDNTRNGQGENGCLSEAEKTLEEFGWGPGAGETYYRNPHGGYSHHGSESNYGPEKENRYRAPSPNRSINLAVPNGVAAPADDIQSVRSGQSGHISIQVPSNAGDDSDEEDQDIHEIWFPGCHADIGGGWKLKGGELWALSHVPLVWMVQEARKAGLELDERKMKQFQCLEEYDGDYTPIQEEIAARRPSQICREEHNEKDDPDAYCEAPSDKQRSAASRDFWHALHTSSTKGLLHDCLEFNQGLPMGSVISWRIMEWLPFRRMDLQSDGQWKPIRWPLPRGEVRDVPLDAEIHVSAIRRMQADPKYRPGNVIVGGGGRGYRIAPEEHGMGDWVVLKNEGDAVRETYVRKSVASKCREELSHQSPHDRRTVR
jgi:uncharacterized protein (DUF2235 family)